APAVGFITGRPAGPVLLGTSITTSAQFSDPGGAGHHSATWDWGDGTTSSGTLAEANGTGTVAGTHSYTAAGTYTVMLTVTDRGGKSGRETLQWVVVYDPNAGFVTGGGWINSP